jgi:hypothetical protein
MWIKKVRIDYLDRKRKNGYFSLSCPSYQGSVEWLRYHKPFGKWLYAIQKDRLTIPQILAKLGKNPLRYRY